MAVTIKITVVQVDEVVAPTTSNQRRSTFEETPKQINTRTQKVRVESDDLRSAVEKTMSILQIIRGIEPWEGTNVRTTAPEREQP